MHKKVAALPASERSYLLGKYAVQCQPKGDECLQNFNSISLMYGNSFFDDYHNRLNFVSGKMFGEDTTPDYVDLLKQEKGFFFCHELIADSYTFFDIRYINFAGGGHGFWLDKNSYFKLTVKVNPGEAVYIGNLKLSVPMIENMVGMRLPSPGNLVLAQPSEGDFSNALAKCPVNVQSWKVRNASFRAEMADGHHRVVNEESSIK